MTNRAHDTVEDIDPAGNGVVQSEIDTDLTDKVVPEWAYQRLLALELDRLDVEAVCRED